MLTAKTIAKKLVDKYQSHATLVAKEMQYWFKKGWYAFGPDHSHTDTEEWFVLKDIPKEIKKLVTIKK